MAAQPMPQPDPGQQGAAPPAAAPPPAPDQNAQPDQGQPSFQAPANPIQVLLAKWSKVAEQMASADPRLSAGAQKVREGIRDMQQAMVTPQTPTSLGQQPQY
jgi:hypothetical protein